MTSLRDERGVALLLVLWIVTLLMVMVTDFSSSMKLEALRANNAKEEGQAYQLALAGKNHALALLLDWSRAASERKGNYVEMEGDLFFVNEEEGASLQELQDQRQRGFPLTPGSYGFRLEDENGKININALNDPDRELLSTLLLESGVTDLEQRDTVVDSLLDWKDDDQDHRLHGAESDYYESLNPPYLAKDGPFDSVEEMLLLKDMSRTPELLYGSPNRRAATFGRAGERGGLPLEYAGIYRYLTVVGAQNQRININTAPWIVLRALGLAEEEANLVLDERQRQPYRRMPPWLALPLRKNLAVIAPGYFTVEAWGRMQGSPVVRTVRILARVRGGQKPVILSWNDNAS